MPRGAYAVLTLFILSRHAKIFEAMNNHLVKQPHHTQPCEDYTHTELNALARLLFKYRSADLAAIYDKRSDKRSFHFDESSLTYVEQLGTDHRASQQVDFTLHISNHRHIKRAKTRNGLALSMMRWHMCVYY